MMPPSLQLKNVCRHFLLKNGAPFTALDNITFEVERGDVFGIVGASGAGKSTLLRILSTLDKPDFGTLEIEGIQVNDYSDASLKVLRQKIGMVFQELYLYSSQTVLENVRFPMQTHPKFKGNKEDQIERAHQLLGLVNLQNKASNYPSMLSGGERQRVAIARALAHAPSLLLCDEMTSALDPKSRRAILDLLKDLKEKLSITIILITHEMELVRRICNRVMVLDGGRLVEKGSVEDLFAHSTHPITQALLQQVEHEIPTQERLPGAAYWLIAFRGLAARQPTLSRMIRQFNIEVNILSGSIDKTSKEEIGRLFVAISGDESQKEAARRFLEEQGVQITLMETSA